MRPFSSLRAGVRAAVVAVIALTAVAAAPKPDLLTNARRFYNQGQYEQALETAKQAAAAPGTASSARLIMGRARLERFRQQSLARDLEDARADFRAADIDALQFIVELLPPD